MRKAEASHPQRIMLRTLSSLLVLVSGLMCASQARGAGALQLLPDRTAYNAGSQVRAEIVFPNGQEVQPTVDFVITVRYAGDSHPVLNHATLAGSVAPTGREYSTGLYKLWDIPSDARTGRYEVDLTRLDPKTGQSAGDWRNAASFSVYRKLVEISRIQLEKTFYISGDNVGCVVTLTNLTDHPLKDLRVEFSDRYWPWIAAPAARVASTIRPLAQDLSLSASATTQTALPDCAVAGEVEKPSVHQYGVVVWDHDRKNIYDISFSQLVFIRPRASSAPTPYPPQFVYPDPGAVDTTNYRQFYPPRFSSGAIRFDTTHTMVAAGGEAQVNFALSNPTDAPWRGVSVLSRWLAPDGTELARNASDKTLDLIPGADPIPGNANFRLPAAPGLYRARVQVVNSFGQVLATNDLEMAANPLPKSILIFCAHEDDEGAWSGLTRAAIENHIPIHFVYFTSGDAGSCDRYYQRSCGPAEALNFGELRMEETRASLGHLGVPREDIFFLGLPDGGSGEIWYGHPDARQPYLSVLLASDHAPYADVAVPNLPYARQSVVGAAEGFIKQFQPEVIVTAHPPQQTHIDHVVNNYFVVKALQELLKQKAVSPDIKVLVDRIYDPKDVPTTPYLYEDHTWYTSGDVATLAQESWWYYQSQGGNRAQGRIKDFDELPRSTSYRVVLDWKDHQGWNEHRTPAESAGQ
jgi:LmbE family N-acetylglucosaminyl deacetylase